MVRQAVFFVTIGLASLANATGPKSKIDPSLIGKRGQLPVVVYSTQHPAFMIACSAWKKVIPEIERLGQRVRRLMQPIQPGIYLSPEQESQFVMEPKNPIARESARLLNEAIDNLEDRTVQEILSEIQDATAQTLSEIAAKITSLGGTEIHMISRTGILQAIIPAHALKSLSGFNLVKWIDSNRNSIAELATSAPSLGATTFWNAGVSGGVYDGGILDTGVYHRHPSLVSHRFESQHGDDYEGTHGTEIAGILASTHATNRGLAFGLDTLSAAFASGTESISMIGLDWLITSTAERPESINYSFGNGTASSADYRPLDQFFDAIVDAFNVMISKSAGNNGFGTGSPTITHPANAYNLISVANMNDQGTVVRSDDVIASSSSRGPTFGGRKKPDICAPGSSITTTIPSSTFSTVSGTSAAAPHVAAAILLLRNLGVTDVRACKAVLLNTADAKDDAGTATTTDDVDFAGSLWNRRYGWGYLDLNEAYLNGLDCFVDQIVNPGSGRTHKLYRGTMFSNEKATLVWNRHVESNGASYPSQIESLSNLDLFAYSASGGGQIASSSSTIDNVEQISVASESDVILKVLASSAFDQDINSETFALATEEGFAPATGPRFKFNLSVPVKVRKDSLFKIKVEVTNVGDLTAFETRILLSGSGLSGFGSFDAGTIAANGKNTIEVTATSPSVSGEYQFSIQVLAACAGEEFGHSVNHTIFVTK